MTHHFEYPLLHCLFLDALEQIILYMITRVPWCTLFAARRHICVRVEIEVPRGTLRTVAPAEWVPGMPNESGFGAATRALKVVHISWYNGCEMSLGRRKPDTLLRLGSAHIRGQWLMTARATTSTPPKRCISLIFYSPFKTAVLTQHPPFMWTSFCCSGMSFVHFLRLKEHEHGRLEATPR